MAKGSKKEGSSQSDRPVIKDSRFSSVHNDPRFNLPNLKNVKVKVDDRFSKKEMSKLNEGAMGKKVKIDRYGRKLKNQDSGKDFDKYYKHEDEESSDDEASEDEEEKEEEEKLAKVESEGDDEEEEEDDDEEEDEAESVFVDRARGEGLESSEEDSSSELDSESDVESEVESEIELEEGKPEEGEPSDSFAVVNMDWDNLRAVDLMATFLSFVPTGGSIKSISIYPSEFGKEQMQKEEVEGPPRDLFKSKRSKVESDSDDSDSEIDVNNKDDLEKAARKLYQEDDGEEDYDSKALRRYQLQRLRYYYAVVRCDSVSTAKKIYDNCDGTEYESTANIFDLRYIPEGMDFDESESNDVCTKIPSNYKPNSTFVTDALQHSKVKLTWDETPKERLNVSTRQFSQKEIDEMDFKAYLASDSDESENETTNNDLKNKYQSLLGNRFNKKEADNQEEDVDMEITFNPALNEAEGKVPEEEEEQEESTIAAYKRKEKERRKRRMEKFKQTQEEENDDQKDTENTAKVTKGKKSKGKVSRDDDDKTKAQLELVMMDEENGDNEAHHFNMKDVIKLEKQKNRKGKKNKKNIDNEMVQDDFKADLNDPRFKEIFESHDYAIDPTSSEFKKTNTMKKILQERSKRNLNEPAKQGTKKQKKHATNEHNSNDLNNLVNKLKRKHNKK